MQVARNIHLLVLREIAKAHKNELKSSFSIFYAF